jgi:diguanylate cyclase (GGDEF)-like protein
MPQPIAELPEFLQHHLKSCRTLRSVPAIAERILELSHKEEVSVCEIAEAVSLDPALSANLLRVSKSAFYGLRYEGTTISHAISVLGANTTLSLALSYSLVKHLRKSSNHGYDLLAYWRRSAIVAAAGRVLAELVDKSLREELYLSGLLQDVGMLALKEAIPRTYDILVAASKGNHLKLVELEREKLEADHATVGAWLLEQWNIPKKYQIAVKNSHNPEITCNPQAAVFCRATAVAGKIAEIWMDPAAATAIALNSAVSLLNITPERFEDLLGKVASAIPEVTSELDIEIGSEEKGEQLLDQAHEALVFPTLQAQQQVQKIRELSRQDLLTAVYNRSYFEEVLPKQFKIASRSGKPLSLLFIDIDYFKNVNDSYGHEAGNAVLAFIASAIKTAVRASDFIARCGAEEFVCLMPNTSAQEAAVIGEQLRASIESNNIAKSAILRVTVSIGGATHSSQQPFAGPRQLLAEADRCLHIAKVRGRNRMIMRDSEAGFPNEEARVRWNHRPSLLHACSRHGTLGRHWRTDGPLGLPD